jgi:hypothetical protein
MPDWSSDDAHIGLNVVMNIDVENSQNDEKSILFLGNRYLKRRAPKPYNIAVDKIR